MSEAVLISIHPAYADAILDGTKKYEFRKTRFRRQVRKLVIYSTYPTSAVVGTADVLGFQEGSPETIWRLCSKHGAIDKDAFFSYFADCDTAIAIELTDVSRFDEAVPLEEWCPGVKPPQSFRYISPLEPSFDFA